MDMKGMLKGVLMTAVGVMLGVVAANLVTTNLMKKSTDTPAA
jgi:hypothetical protein